jgi:hypothetical protein
LTKPRNQFEKKLDKQLKKSKVQYAYERDRIPYILARFYLPDFVVSTTRGLLYIEAKGHLRREDKAKLAAVKKQHPEKDIRIVFYNKNKQYIRWAERNGFRYSFETIPKEWLDGL